MRMRFNALLCQRYVYLWMQLFFDGCTTSGLAIAYSYSVTCSNNQFCRNCKYYDFETVQHCNETTTTSPKMSPSGEALWELTENRTMPWWFLLFSNSAVEKLCFSRHPKSTKQVSFVATVSTERYRFDFSLFGLVGASLRWLVLGLAIAVVNPF